MGGSGSSRWKDHQKAPRVEDAFELDVMSLAPSLQHDQIDGELPLTDNRTGGVNGQFSFCLSRVTRDGSRRLMIDPGDNRRRQSIRLERAQRGWYRSWFFVCPADCGRRARKLYADRRWLKFMCRKCGGLTYASTQTHDSRVDQLLRDPLGFEMARSRAPQTSHSRRVTAWLTFTALERATKPRKGRGWSRHAVTSGTRAIAQMHQEFRDRWGFGLEDVGKVARGG